MKRNLLFLLLGFQVSIFMASQESGSIEDQMADLNDLVLGLTLVQEEQACPPQNQPSVAPDVAAGIYVIRQFTDVSVLAVNPLADSVNPQDISNHPYAHTSESAIQGNQKPVIGGSAFVPRGLYLTSMDNLPRISEKSEAIRSQFDNEVCCCSLM